MTWLMANWYWWLIGIGVWALIVTLTSIRFRVFLFGVFIWCLILFALYWIYDFVVL